MDSLARGHSVALPSYWSGTRGGKPPQMLLSLGCRCAFSGGVSVKGPTRVLSKSLGLIRCEPRCNNGPRWYQGTIVGRSTLAYIWMRGTSAERCVNSDD
jgi:hypothetical protein